MFLAECAPFFVQLFNQTTDFQLELHLKSHPTDLLSKAAFSPRCLMHSGMQKLSEAFYWKPWGTVLHASAPKAHGSEGV
jgi:hypothetical protein